VIAAPLGPIQAELGGMPDPRPWAPLATAARARVSLRRGLVV
jgi:hypothetical protein